MYLKTELNPNKNKNQFHTSLIITTPMCCCMINKITLWYSNSCEGSTHHMLFDLLWSESVGLPVTAAN